MSLVEDLHDPLPSNAQAVRKCQRAPMPCRGYASGYRTDFLKQMVTPHVASFDFFLTKGLEAVVEEMTPLVFTPPGLGHQIKFQVRHLEVGAPQYSCPDPLPLTPQMCREQSITYQAPLMARIETEMNGLKFEFDSSLGMIPIMVGSQNCRLAGKTPEQLVALREDEREVGGYFLSNGTERIIRMVVIPKSGLPQCMQRTAYLKRGSAFTDKAISYRDRRSDCRTQTIVLHALKDGSCMVRMLIEKKEYFLPLCLVLRALKATTDREIYAAIVESEEESEAYVIERVQMMLRDFHNMKLRTTAQALAYIGSSFRNVCFRNRTDLDDTSVGREVLARHLFFSLDSNQNKFDLLCDMARRLYLFTQDKIVADNQDSTANHDVLLAGHLFTAYMSECMETVLENSMYAVMKHQKMGHFEYTEDFFRKKGVFKHGIVESKFHSLISVGALQSPSGLDLLQQDSFSVTADRLNFVRFLAHFRSIHRGKFFTEMKTTAVRKMLPESYGFLCPVHTPDGAPCGLLNHLGYQCGVVVADAHSDEVYKLEQLCRLHGVSAKQQGAFPVILNGRVLGYMMDSVEMPALKFVQLLRLMKCRGDISKTTEIGFVPPNNPFKLYPQLILLTKAARYTRKVFNLQTQSVEFISPFEQLFLEIAIFDSEITPETSHQELSPVTMLSTVASLVPFPDHNQSPRNMYECQMLKQTMGFPARSISYRVDAKNYRILTPQRPVVHTAMHSVGGFDSHPTGTNAVVAVLSYSGYDMEDACLINKNSLERGLFNGTVYQVEDIDLMEELNISRYSKQFGYFKGDDAHGHIDKDGLPFIGSVLTTGDPVCQFYDPVQNKIRDIKYTSREAGIVEKVILTRDQSVRLPIRAKIVIRHDRSPIIGDKFASRHGQKGTLGIKFCGRDMPFGPDGITPDLIINPHAFPSRMTIGMLLESLGGKLSAITGRDTDATPFQYSTEYRALDVLGTQLQKHGFCKYGSDVLYSGISGEMMPVNIFIGVVYYQRLRHMVNDKYQVRATGKCDAVTHQPVKGRKQGGGTRFGEMERDALLAHGTQQLLRGRLCTDSDVAVFHACSNCGNVLNSSSRTCAMCNGQLRTVHMPMVAGVLASELAGMGIFLGFKAQ